MNRLSTEILLSIFGYLPVSDKLQCYIVCKNWNEKLSKSNLFAVLTFKNNNNFNKCLQFFSKSNTRLKNQVQVLNIDAAAEKDPTMLHTALTLFSNIRQVKWIDNTEFDFSLDLSTAHDFLKGSVQPTDGFWNRIEKLTILSDMFCIKTYLLTTGTYTNLKYLDVTLTPLPEWKDSHTIRSKLLSIIDNIHNAPALETLVFTNASISLHELEKLHSSLPNLKELKLIGTHVVPNNEKVKVRTPARLIHSFSISLSTSVRFPTPTIETINSWLVYIGQKYKHAKGLDVRYCEDEDESLENSGICPIHYVLEEISEGLLRRPFQDSILDLFPNMPFLENYSMLIFPGIGKSITNAMDMHNIQLKSIHLVFTPDDGLDEINNDKEMDVYYESLLLSKQSEHIQELTVSTSVPENDIYSTFIVKSILRRGINGLCHLTSLKIEKCLGSRHSSGVLLYILQCLRNLEHLSIDLFRDDSCDYYSVGPVNSDYEDEDYFEDFIYDNFNDDSKLVTNNLKSLTLTQFIFADVKPSSIKTNSLFEKVWKICHRLESFTLSGSLFRRADYLLRNEEEMDPFFLNLYFTSTQLKSVTIDMEGFDFYQFNEIPEKKGKRWNDFYHQEIKPTPTIPPKYIKISWIEKLESLNLTYLAPYKYESYVTEKDHGNRLMACQYKP